MDIFSFNLFGMEDSPIFWRFDKMESKVLESGHNSIDQSTKLWNSKISSRYNHLMQIPLDWDEEWKEIRKFKVDTDRDTEGQELLLSIVPNHDIEVQFFWSRKYSIKVNWRFFLDHWTDFCYPDDDNIAILIDDFHLLIFCEECFTLYRKRG